MQICRGTQTSYVVGGGHVDGCECNHHGFEVHPAIPCRIVCCISYMRAVCVSCIFVMRSTRLVSQTPSQKLHHHTKILYLSRFGIQGLVGQS